MSSIASVTVFDGAATPVSHTFSPKGVKVKDGVWTALWTEGLASVPAYACPRLSLTIQPLKSGQTRVATRFEIPVMESISGQNSSGYTAAPKVAYVTTTELVQYSHERATQADRRLSRMLPINFGNNVSTSVAAAQAGPAYEAFDWLIAPT